MYRRTVRGVGANHRLVLLMLCTLACAPLAQAQTGKVEAAFAAVPFSQWVGEGEKAELPWHLRMTSPTLTLHQRIAVRIDVELDGNELVKRCCDGQAVALVEITDPHGQTYRNYGGKELREAKPGMSQYMLGISWEIFLLPGEYKATIAFYYSGRKSHSLAFRRIQVGPLNHDPLPGAWRDLPVVEFADPQPEGLDAFLLPNIQGRLHLPIKARQPMQVEILENVTPYPSERRHPKLYHDRLGVFLPILKVFGDLEVENGTLGMSLLDFTRRNVIFDQQNIRDGQVSWASLKDAMAENSESTVDVHDLRHGEEFGEFFWSEVTRRLAGAGADGGRRVLIIISGPMDLGSRKPVDIAPLREGNFAVFYLRCEFFQTPTFVRSPIFAGPVEPSEQKIERLQDGVGKTLRRLKPRVFAVNSAEAVRSAFASIVNEISRM